MKAFVTGGTGFIGSHLVDELISSQQYDDIRCLVRNDEKWLSGKNYTKIKGDLFDLHALSEAVEGVDVIFHIAAIVKAQTQKEFTLANVEATENLIRIAQKKGISNIVLLSSQAAAGPSSGTPVTEKDALRPVSMYGHSKKEMEEIIHIIAQKNDSIKIIRPPSVYGPRENQIYIFFKTFSRGICPIVGDGNHPQISMVYVKDLVQGIMKAAQKKDEGIHTYFVGGQEDNYSWNQIREITTIAMNKKAIPVKINPKLVKKIAGVIESSASLFGSYPVVNREKANEMILEWVCSSNKAKRELGYAPEVSLEEGISRTIRWYKQYNWL